MRNRYFLVSIAFLSWVIFGLFVIGPAAYFILSYGQMANAIGVGAVLGAVLGLVVGVIAVSPSVSANRVAGFRWVLMGSMVGVIVGVGLLLWWGGFPHHTQADLSLILLGPASLAIGALGGLFAAAALWRFWRARTRRSH